MVAVSVSYSLSVWAQQSDLLFEVRVAKTPVIVGEPVYVTLRLGNTGNMAQSVYPEVGLLSGVVEMHIADPRGNPLPFVPLTVGEPDADLISLEPGEALVAMEPVFYGGRGWTFQAPGIYTIHGVYDHQPVGEVRSATVTLEVIAGDGTGERLIDGDDTSKEAARFLLWFGGDHLTQGIAELEQVGVDNPQSPVASHYYLAMASNLAAPFRNFAVGRVREPQPTSALSYLARVDIDALPPELVVRSYIVGARAATLVGDADQANGYLRRARAMIDADPLLYELFHMELDGATSRVP